MSNKKYKKDEWIKSCNEIHSNKYQYIISEGFKSTDKITIICPIHGEFMQIASAHKFGKGCKHCAIQFQIKNKLIKNKSSLLESFNRTHNGFYSYDEDELLALNKITDKIRIICPIHGEFFQSASRHKHQGCFKCAVIKRSESHIVSSTEYFLRAKIIHNNYYTYNENEQLRANGKISVWCPDHGQFITNVRHHIYDGSKCPKCPTLQCGGYSLNYFNSNPSKKSKPAFLYFIELYNNNEKFYKIGITARTMKKRLQEFKPYISNIIISKNCTLFEAFTLEQKILKLPIISGYVPLITFYGSKLECFHINDPQHIIDMF